MLDLRINMKSISVWVIFSLFFINCKNDTTLVASDLPLKENDTIIFKNWLKDTITNLKKEDLDYKVYEDSTLLEVYKSYDTILEDKLVLKNKDLFLAYELLKENNDLSLENVDLNLKVIHSYEVSQVGKDYDYSFEIKKFEVSNKEKKIIYNYIKGNLIDKKEINLKDKFK